MSSSAGLEGIRFVPFSDEWLEEFLDLSTKSDTKDPLYAQGSREDARKRLKLHQSMGITKAHVLAVEGTRVVGSARVNLVTTCGDQGKAYLALMVTPDRQRRGIGGKLVDRVCDAMASQGVEWIEMGILDAWEGWRRFFGKYGFEATDLRSADVAFPADARIPESLPEVGARIRVIRLPEDRARYAAFFNRELRADLPDACAIPSEGPMPWEIEPDARHFDPTGFLLAEDPRTGELVGYAWAMVIPDEGPRGILEGVDVAERLLSTPLRTRLLFEGLAWLRKKGVTDIRGRIHPARRSEEQLFRSAGFTIHNAATVWRKNTRRTPPKGGKTK